jgi:hypothetical protein
MWYLWSPFSGAFYKSLAADMVSWFHTLDAEIFIMGIDVPVF